MPVDQHVEVLVRKEDDMIGLKVCVITLSFIHVVRSIAQVFSKFSSTVVSV